MKILLAQINSTIGDLEGNTKKIIEEIQRAKSENAALVVFPELALTGYPPEDLLLLPHFMDAVEHHLKIIVESTKDIMAIVGIPRRNKGVGKPLYNSAAVICKKSILGYQDKILLPTYDVFDEHRYFEAGTEQTIWTWQQKRIGITICEDIWHHSSLIQEVNYSRDPVLDLSNHSPDLVVNLSASPYSLNKFDYRLQVCIKAAKTLKCPFLLCNQVGANDCLIFDGYSIAIDATGQVKALAAGFKEDALFVTVPFEGNNVSTVIDPIESLYSALVLGVRDYFHKLGFKKACIALSGGIDSALVACIAVDALGKENILTVMLPSRYSSRSSREDAQQLAERLGIECIEIPIEQPFQTYLDLLHPHFKHKPEDVTEENLQSRIRGMIMMALSNKHGYVVLSTGNKSELAMGYATLYGDMCGGIGVISDVTKVQVYALAKWINRKEEIIPWNTIEKAPSAELRPDQKDSDSLPPYEVLDNILAAYIEEHRAPNDIAEAFGYSLALVQDIISRIHRNEYKRRQSAPGLRVTEKAFSIGRHFPIVQRWKD